MGDCSQLAKTGAEAPSVLAVPRGRGALAALSPRVAIDPSPVSPGDTALETPRVRERPEAAQEVLCSQRLGRNFRNGSASTQLLLIS